MLRGPRAATLQSMPADFAMIIGVDPFGAIGPLVPVRR
jgi:hypothetical protein